jgi:hypothetical protein
MRRGAGSGYPAELRSASRGEQKRCGILPERRRWKRRPQADRAHHTAQTRAPGGGRGRLFAITDLRIHHPDPGVHE